MPAEIPKIKGRREERKKKREKRTIGEKRRKKRGWEGKRLIIELGAGDGWIDRSIDHVPRGNNSR